MTNRILRSVPGLGETDLELNELLWAGLAEFAGTFLFVLLGVGTIVATGHLDGGMTADRLIAIGLGMGVSLGLLVAATGNVSGGHINPAVTIAMLAARRIGLVRAQLYIGAQISGAIFGAVLLYIIAPGDGGTLGATMLGSGVGPVDGLVLETILTFALVFAVFVVAENSTLPSATLGPALIGLVVALDHLVGVPLSGASMNPARSFGPALVSGEWADHWVYWVGPVTGGLLAALFYRRLYPRFLHKGAEPSQ